MFSSLDIVNAVARSSARRRSTWLSIGLKNAPNRRLVSQLMCRLPILFIWTIAVIFILYKVTSSSDSVANDEDSAFRSDIIESQFPTDKFQSQALTSSDEVSRSKQFLTRPSTSPSLVVSKVVDTNKYQDHAEIIKLFNEKLGQQSDSHQIETTLVTAVKEQASEYVRSSKVFILIVQDDHHPVNHRPINTKDRLPFNSLGEESGGHRQLEISAHIRLLIDILRSHRIPYAIDTTRKGLPAALLIDQNDNKSTKQFSVIIIDDFIKYTKLNRWIRDQLDRHCRSNDIGVITYLTPESAGQATPLSPSSPVHTTSFPTGKKRRDVKSTSSRTTEVSLADQFPLKFKLIDQQKSCANLSSNMCLVDYQLNERSPILRVLKRKQSFVLNGPLIENLNNSPWISMSSNHITYQPITWARIAQPGNEQMDYSSDVDAGRPRIASAISLSTRDRNRVGSGQPEPQTGADSSAGNASHQPKRLFPSVGDSKGKRSRRTDTNASISTVVGGGSFGTLLNNLGEQIQSGDKHEKSSSSSIGNGVSVTGLREDVEADSLAEPFEVLVMLDRGLYDGVRRIIFGGANHHWMNRILLLDAIEHFSSGQILSPLDRYIQIDIDDIFVGEHRKRMNASDVLALVRAQEQFAKLIDGGFKFNLGFSGRYFKHGTDSENSGDEQLIAQASHFNWFCHFWSHSKAHLFNDTRGIVSELTKNLEFAKSNKLPIIGYGANSLSDYFTEAKPLPPTYAIAPHHSGVYPIHQQLYEAWQTILNVRVTSTEEYPHLRPANERRGFVHKTIKVLPRQTCGLYTHTIYRDKYPGGIGKLEESIRGGELFETILHNPVNIYMTHMSNYAHDRLALSTFTSLIEFVQEYTNLQLKFAPSGMQNPQMLGPEKLADYYFTLYPEDKNPLWTNPCDDKRHLAIYSPEKRDHCLSAPKILIVGPQKTGTTALYSFLKINPEFESSKISPLDYEEVQFFNDKHYFEGVDWYWDRFSSQAEPLAQKSSPDESTYFYDKSATYFDDPKVPRRASSLLPEARIIIMLIDPADRAYSWYQHMRAHKDVVANSITFEQLILGAERAPGDTTSDFPETNKTIALRNRCLHPGYYAQHLISWLDHYPSRQVIIIDGQWFRHNPASVMNRLQVLLRVQRPIDYHRHLVFDEHKGFHCQIDASTGRPKCLGESKGRKYEPMSREARMFLNRHYLAHNKQLARILNDIGQPLPNWLDEIMGITHSNSVRFRRN